MDDRRALHERIAETLEPRPTLDANFMYWHDTKGLPWSKSGAWYFTGVEDVWHAANFDTDEAANAMLRDAMLNGGCRFQLDGSFVAFGNDFNEIHRSGMLTRPMEANELAEFFTDAYARWKGLI